MAGTTQSFLLSTYSGFEAMPPRFPVLNKKRVISLNSRAQARAIRRQWLDCATITKTEAFTALPTFINDQLPTVDARHRWLVEQETGLIVLSKTNRNTITASGHLAYQKIVADLGTFLELPVLPGVIWQRPNRSSFITPLAYSAASEKVPTELIVKNPYLPAMAIFDTLIVNCDRISKNMTFDVYDPMNADKLVYLDHEICLNTQSPEYFLLDKPEKTLAVAWFYGDARRKEILESAVKQVGDSPVAQTLVKRLTEMPRDVLHEIVYRIPDTFFHKGNGSEKAIIVEGLHRRAKAVPEMVSRLSSHSKRLNKWIAQPDRM